MEVWLGIDHLGGEKYSLLMQVTGRFMASISSYLRKADHGPHQGDYALPVRGMMPRAHHNHLRSLVMLDSAGFTAMKMGGYRFSVEEYVDYIVKSSRQGEGCPWVSWSSMDLCCEPEIAKDTEAIEDRIEGTAELYGQILDELGLWRIEYEAEGYPEAWWPGDPMPVLQGRTVPQYLRSYELLQAQARRHGRPGLPKVLGLGSVCRRPLGGAAGLMAVLHDLRASLPNHQLHCFGVKSGALTQIREDGLEGFVYSVDSMAYEYRARMAAITNGERNTNLNRVKHARRWLKQQGDSPAEPAQLQLF